MCPSIGYGVWGAGLASLNSLAGIAIPPVEYPVLVVPPRCLRVPFLFLFLLDFFVFLEALDFLERRAVARLRFPDKGGKEI